MRIAFLLLSAFIFSHALYAQDFTHFRARIEQHQDTIGMYDLYEEVKNSALPAEDMLAIARLLESKASTLGYSKIQGLSIDFQGLAYRNLGDTDKALETFDRAWEVLMSTQNISSAAWVDFDIAVTHYLLGQFDQSMEAINRNLEATKDISAGQYNTLLRTAGEILRGANRLDRAADYLQTAIEHSRSTGMKEPLSYNLNRLGVVYYQGSKHQLAKEALEESLELAQEINLDRAITMNLNDMGELYFALKDYERCIELYEVALGREMVDGDRANTYNNVARLYWELDKSDEAIEYAMKALELGEATQSLPYIVDAQKILADSYKDKGAYRQSTDYYQAYITSKDSLFKLETQRQLADAETKYETAKKEQEIASLSEKEALERSRKQAYRTGLISAAVLLMIVLLLAWQLSKNKKRIESQNKELGELNATKDKFFSIIAHDLRSPMIALQGVGRKLDFFIRKGKEDKLLEMGGKIDESIDRLNHLLNNLLNWAVSESGGMPFHPEKLKGKELIQATVDLYSSIAEAKDVKLNLDMETVEMYGDRNMLSTVFRNLLSNAIKFTKESGTVSISAKNTDTHATVEISDEGIGIDQKTMEELFGSEKSTIGTKGEQGFGLGLKLCKEFIEKNSGTIQVESRPGSGTTFTIQLLKAQLEQSLKVA